MAGENAPYHVCLKGGQMLGIYGTRFTTETPGLVTFFDSQGAQTGAVAVSELTWFSERDKYVNITVAPSVSSPGK